MLILADHKLSQSVAYKGKAKGWNGFICLDERKCISFTTDLCFVLWCIAIKFCIDNENCSTVINVFCIMQTKICGIGVPKLIQPHFLLPLFQLAGCLVGFFNSRHSQFFLFWIMQQILVSVALSPEHFCLSQTVFINFLMFNFWPQLLPSKHS